MVENHVAGKKSAPPTHSCEQQSGDEFFVPTSKIWQVDRELVLLLAGGRALLMQIAHPKVAAGVAQHSRFQEDPLGRLYRTMSAMWSIVFDDKSKADASLRQVEMTHKRVQGNVPAGEPAQARTAYAAFDQELLLWVHATLIDTAMVAYNLFVAPLTPAERQDYYNDSKKLAALFGIHERNIPQSVQLFDSYMTGILASGGIQVGPTAKNLARDVLFPRPCLLRPVGPVFRLVTAGLLPAQLREGYGLPWNARREEKLAFLAKTIRWLLPFVPALLRVVPNARKAEKVRRRRLARATRS
jgi:uncharacterized protein (DUF2236 family)